MDRRYNYLLKKTRGLSSKWRKLRKDLMRHEMGITLIETLVALAILGVTSVAFLAGLATTHKAGFLADEQVTVESLAESQMEWVKSATYVYGVTSYSPAPVPDGKEYAGYSVVITAEPLSSPDNGIQRITVTVLRSSKGVLKLQGYKVD